MQETKPSNRLITFQVTEALNNRLREIAWTERKTLSALLRELVWEGLRQKEKVSGVSVP